MATREEWDKWRTGEGAGITPPKRRRLKEKTTQVEVIHDTGLFEKLRKRLVLDTTKQHGISPEIKRYLTAIKITDISDITNRGGGEVETQRNLKDGNEKGLYHFTINTELNIDAEYFIDAIEDQEHTNGECWINLLIDHYKDTLMSKNKWESKRLTRDKILKLMNKTEEEFKEHGASVEDMKAVFEEFRLSVRLYNCFSKRVFTYDPEKKNKHNNALYGMIKGNHIYTMNDNIISVAHREINEDLKLCASTDFHLNKKEEPVKYEMFNSVDDVMKILKDNPDIEEINLVSKKHLNNVYCDFKRCCYEPRVIMSAGGNISSIKLKFNKTVLNVRSQDLINCAVERCEYTDDASVFNRVNEGMFKFNKALFNPYHKSYYHKDDKQIFDIAHSIAPCGYLDRVLKNKGVELDRNKAYTKGTMDITKIPIFCEFDIWKKYDYEKDDFNKMNELTLYLVKSKVKNMFFNRSYNLIYGMYLKEYYEDVEIIYYKIPSKIAKVDYKKLILDLWNMKFDDDEVKDKKIKKMLFNINIGLLEKQSNTVKKSFVFNKMVDAFYYQELYGGTINVINEIERDDEEDELGFTNIISQNKHYVLNISDTKTLKNGYRYIKELILQNHNHAMNTAYETLLKNGINVYSVKTDAFVIDTFNLKKARELLNFSNAIGDWKYNYKYIHPYNPFHKQVSKLVDITEYTNKTGIVKDEYNTDEIIDDHVLTNRRLMIRGDVPGTGKSFICKHLQEKGYNVVFVVPTNNLKQECGVEAMTINKFFGISYGDERLEKCDFSGFDVIVFDEIYFHNPAKWVLIWDFCLNNPDKIVVATGDTNQLKNPEKVSDVFKFEDYANHCIDLIFENNIKLYECKRLKNEEDRKKLYDIKDMILNRKEPIMNVIEKYFGWSEGNEICENNIAYTNNTCKKVSKKIRDMKGIKDEYIIGEYLICRKYTKTNGKKFNVNIKYEIVSIDGDKFILKNVGTGDEQGIVRKLLQKNFIYAYCYTTHSKQGCSVDDDIVIYDWSLWCCCPNWYWTSITRTRDLNKVKFYKYDTDDNNLTQMKVETYFKNKVMNYKEQDKTAGRVIDNGDYVDVNYLMNMMNETCQNCNEPLTIDMENGNIVSNITCQRVNNDIGHYKSNCVSMCHQCNCAFSNKISL